MPRKAKSLPASTAPGQAYGVAGDQKQAMNILPLPDNRPAVPTGATQPAAPQPVAQTPQPGLVDPLAAALQAATMMEPPTSSLDAPTTMPTQPVTAGLPVGPGPGPEALSMLRPSMKPTPVANVLSTIATANGNNPLLAELAATAKTKGI